jgi:hypothetical protein
MEEYSPAELARFREIAKRYKPHGVRVVWRRNIARYATRGSAYPGLIACAEPNTRTALYIFLHECGHFHLGHFRKDRPAFVEEYEAERWAQQTMRREGVAVPQEDIWDAKSYVAEFIKPGDVVPHRIRRWLGEFAPKR